MSQQNRRDTLYREPWEKVPDFAFDEAVAAVFPDMIRRSVPGYTSLLPLIGLLTRHFFQPGSRCYDLGCSLGAATRVMGQAMAGQAGQLIAVDNSPAMIASCQQYLDQEVDSDCLSIALHCADIRDFPVADASVIVLNFTLQFIAPEERSRLLGRLYEGLRPGGVLLLSEKIRCTDQQAQQLLTTLHHEFKRANGYTDLEISQKRSALEQVLQAETIEAHRKRLEEAGFRQVQQWFQCLNFVSLLAVR